MPTPREVIDYLLPSVVTAGAYSAAVQGRIGVHAAKEGSTAFHHALSDADLTIQAFLEVALLAKYPDLSFFSEEQDQSLNLKYFPEGQELEVLLDPVDGTKAYIDNRAAYQVIVTLHDQQSICGSICYLPRADRCFIAVKDEGAFSLSAEEIRLRSPGTQISVRHATGPVLVFNQPELVAALHPFFDVRDLAVEYASKAWSFATTDLLVGRASAIISAPCQAIDGGSLAFIAHEAGAIVSDPEGNPMGSFRGNPKRVLPCIVAAATAEVHLELLKALRGVKGIR
jgi:fructose-1,6-bisphosphatase/inositol monophosphatase family enzyme